VIHLPKMTEAEKARDERLKAEALLKVEQDNAALAVQEAMESAAKLEKAREDTKAAEYFRQQSVSLNFLRRHPEVTACPKNAAILAGVVQKRFRSVWTEENLEAAYEICEKHLTLEGNKATPVEIKPPQETLFSGYKLESKVDINKIPPDVFKELMLNDVTFKERVGKILRGEKL
jgi:hypothetical protein